MSRTIHRPQRLNVGLIALALSMLFFGAGTAALLSIGEPLETPTAPTEEALISMDSNQRFQAMAEYSVSFVRYLRESDARVLRLVIAILLYLVAAPLAVVACYECWLASTPPPSDQPPS